MRTKLEQFRATSLGKLAARVHLADNITSLGRSHELDLARVGSGGMKSNAGLGLGLGVNGDFIRNLVEVKGLGICMRSAM
jgi:hypothetical protein